MNLQEVSELAQVIGNVAVIVTLVVLIVQIRANTRAVDRQKRVDRGRALRDAYFASPDLVRALVKINATNGGLSLHVELAERFGLTPEEGWLVMMHQGGTWSIYEADFLASGPSASLERSIVAYLGGPHNLMGWQHLRRARDAAFAHYVDAIAARAGREGGAG